MQDGAPTGCAADYLPDARLQARPVHVREGLAVPERETGWVPRIEPQGGERFPTSNMLQDRLVHGHVPGAAPGGGKDQSPGFHAVYCTAVCHINALLGATP